MKIVVIFGTRPEAIKLAPVVSLLKARSEVTCRVCVTAQHRAMLDQVLDVFDIVPDKDLNLMRPNQSLASITARALDGLDCYLSEERPDMVVLQGDTATVLSGALASFFRRIPIGHVEAGLRTGNLQSPWPEECNRVLTSRLATLHFAPTVLNEANLLREGVRASNIFVTGNTVIDALLMARSKLKNREVKIEGLEIACNSKDDPVVLVTLHRRENFGRGLESVCEAIKELALERPQVQFVCPVHPNPNVEDSIRRILGMADRSKSLLNIHLIKPQPYLEFVSLMMRAKIILTDSGGIQEEAPSLGKPVLVLRETTERPEAVTAGTVFLVGTDKDRIKKAVDRLLDDDSDYLRMQNVRNPYGDGKAAERIVEACVEFVLHGHLGT